MSLSGVARPDAFEYVGGELDVVANAVNWKRYFGSRIAPYVRGDVLEVGAGIGETTRHLCDGRQRSWLCLEPDARLAQRARERFDETALTPRPQLRVGTLADMDSAARFDAILYIDVLEHIDQDREELARASEHLAPGGAIVVLSPAFNVLFSELDRALGHYRRYTRQSLAAVFPSTLRRRRLFYLDSLGCAASLANRLMLKQTVPSPRQVAFWDGIIVPASRWVDPVLARMFGRSVIAVYDRP
jgi:SAM-dependent methyltransferase